MTQFLRLSLLSILLWFPVLMFELVKPNPVPHVLASWMLTKSLPVATAIMLAVALVTALAGAIVASLSKPGAAHRVGAATATWAPTALFVSTLTAFSILGGGNW